MESTRDAASTNRSDDGSGIYGQVATNEKCLMCLVYHRNTLAISEWIVVARSHLAGIGALVPRPQRTKNCSAQPCIKWLLGDPYIY